MLRPMLELAVLIPGTLLAYLPMKEHLKIKMGALTAIWLSTLLMLCIVGGLFCYSFEIKTISLILPAFMLMTIAYCATLRTSILKSANIALAVCGVYACLASITRAIDSIVYPKNIEPWFGLTGGIVFNIFCWIFVMLAFYPASHAVCELIDDENGTANQVWRFLRQTDGSYKIVSCLDGKCLDVQGASYEGGANVQVFTDHSHDAQRWYIFSYNGGYMLQSKLSGLFLDLYQCIPDEGNNIDLWSRNYSESQIFSFYNGEECKLSSPVLNVNVDSKNIKFSWNNVYGENYYNLRIWNEKHWENDSYLNLWNIPANKTETDIQLPAGNFEAYVDTGNYYDVRMSNVVSFTVKPKINTRIMNNKSVVFNWDEVLKAKSYNLEIINKSNNGVISKNNLTENSFITFLDSGKYSVRIISDNNVVSDSMDFEIKYKDQLIGDVNSDGIVSIADATELQKHLANIIDFDDEQLAVADTNGDGSVSIADVTQIQKYLAQLIPSLG